MRGKFITFEGIEGSGKSTQIRRLAAWARRQGFKVHVTREPGGSRIGDKIRDILLQTRFKEMAPVTELLLYAAGRAQHVAQVIRPLLRRGAIVLCDRFADSTTAYQGGARRLSDRALLALHRIAAGGLTPDLTILLDLPVHKGFKRIRGRARRKDRLEKEKQDFHQRVRRAYLVLARREKRRIKVVDASLAAEKIHQKILGEVKKIL